jgi:hypothetical protein
MKPQVRYPLDGNESVVLEASKDDFESSPIAFADSSTTFLPEQKNFALQSPLIQGIAGTVVASVSVERTSMAAHSD